MSQPQPVKSTILSCRNIYKKFDQQDVLSDVTFTLSKGEKIGIVGPNGSGKTTLLTIVAGLLEKDAGSITYSKNLKVEYLPQLHEKFEELSQGEIAKKILAPIISSDAGLFLLDEPTNNLDIVGLNKVEHFIGSSAKSFIIVSHDREFLDKTVDKIIELNPVSKTSTIYSGGYSSYMEQKEARIGKEWKDYADKVEKMDKLSSNLEQSLRWVKKIEAVRKNIKHLPKNEKEKPVAAYLRDKEGEAGKRAKVIKNKLERYKESSEVVSKPKELLPLKIEFAHTKGSSKVFDLPDVTKSMRVSTLGPLNLTIQYGDRWHIIGKNGAGKTTLIKLLVGEIKPDNGELIRGENVIIGYVSQEKIASNNSVSVIEHFMRHTEFTQTNARKILNRFRITTEDIKKEVSLLSPGEYSRLVIAELISKKPNCIILDEPSNHLDLEILEELEKGLKNYTGTLIVVSHDRYFVNSVDITKVFDLEKIKK